MDKNRLNYSVCLFSMVMGFSNRFFYGFKSFWTNQMNDKSLPLPMFKLEEKCEITK